MSGDQESAIPEVALIIDNGCVVTINGAPDIISDGAVAILECPLWVYHRIL